MKNDNSYKSYIKLIFVLPFILSLVGCAIGGPPVDVSTYPMNPPVYVHTHPIYGPGPGIRVHTHHIGYHPYGPFYPGPVHVHTHPIHHHHFWPHPIHVHTHPIHHHHIWPGPGPVHVHTHPIFNGGHVHPIVVHSHPIGGFNHAMGHAMLRHM